MTHTSFPETLLTLAFTCVLWIVPMALLVWILLRLARIEARLERIEGRQERAP